MLQLFDKVLWQYQRIFKGRIDDFVEMKYGYDIIVR